MNNSKDKRLDRRVDKKLMINLNNNGVDILGLTSNLSKHGMCCMTSEIELPKSHEIALSIAVPGEIFTLKGEVVWCKRSSENGGIIPDAIGIRITEAPSEYLNYIEFIKHQSIKPGEPEF